MTATVVATGTIVFCTAVITWLIVKPTHTRVDVFTGAIQGACIAVEICVLFGLFK